MTMRSMDVPTNHMVGLLSKCRARAQNNIIMNGDTVYEY